LGRLLRPKNDNKQAILFEIVSSGTSEALTSERRHRNIMK
jgi:superfamily II DNA or RNA helicase